MNVTAASAQRYAKVAAILFLISMIAGGLGEFYIPNKLVVSGNATETANNVVTFNSMFRWGFAAYLVEAICDIALSLVWYVLLRPVRKDIALLAAFFGLVSTSVFAGAELFYFAASFILGGADYLKTFSPDQLNTLGMLSLKFYAAGAGIFMALYGIASGIRGYLIFKSGYLPKSLGALLMLAGIGFIAKNFTLVLVPAYSSDLFLAAMPLAGLFMTGWLFVKGIDATAWPAHGQS